MRVYAIRGGRWLGLTLLAAPFLLPVLSVSAAEGTSARRQIETVIVTAERKEASVQDTSISMTALTSEFMEDFGIRNQSDLQNFIPATTIQPYDATVRGVGRNFRALGGDPGVSTYINGVYSEDLYTATLGGLYDLERLEVLRGPQGTLYGRNAVGGAMNFIYKKPTDQFAAQAKSALGVRGIREFYGMVSGPIIKDVLEARFTAVNRERRGTVAEKGHLGPDLDGLNEESYALSLKFTPTDNLEFNLRQNKNAVSRPFGGANGGGLVVLSELDSNRRNTTVGSFGYRPIDRTQTNPAERNFFDASQPVFSFTNPQTGVPLEAQFLRDGIDVAGIPGLVGLPGVPVGAGPERLTNVTGRPNQAFGVANPRQCVFGGNGSHINGGDICATTNGLNHEGFDQNGTQFDVEWTASDRFSLKYIFGYNDLFYDRTTDDDLVANTKGGLDRQFFVNHEATYVSHELQAFFDVSDKLSFTSGLFYYRSHINQRGDFYDSNAGARYAGPVAGITQLFTSFLPFGALPKAKLFDAKRAAKAAGVQPAIGGPTRGGPPHTSGTTTVVGPWAPDTGNRIPHGPITKGTDLEYATSSEREAFAAYTQGVWDMTDTLTLTFGIRWAQDNLDGEENLFRYQEADVFSNATTNLASPFGVSLATYNVLRGALDPVTLAPTGAVPIRFTGIPISVSVNRTLERSDQKVTWRVNLDWSPTDNSLYYFSITTGERAGGFNLVFFSSNPTYQKEQLINYEIGVKNSFLDNSLQFNGSVYFYDYKQIHTVGEGTNTLGSVSTSTFAAPGARIFGVEGDLLWLATDRLSVGGNFSFTPSSYTKDLLLVDSTDPSRPEGLFEVTKTKLNINGNQLLQVPDLKYTVFGTYSIPLANLGAVEFSSNYSWISKVYFSPFQNSRDKANAYGRLDARVTWRSSDHWIASAYVNNVFDDIGIRQILRDAGSGGYRRSAEVTERRLFGLELTYNLGAGR